MTSANHYETLEVSANATQAQIKQAYRRLAKQHHPDSNRQTDDLECIVRINAAYEVLGDPLKRREYNQRLFQQVTDGFNGRSPQSANGKEGFANKKPKGRETDEYMHLWLQQVYTPVDRSLRRILNSLKGQIDHLAADPFDDELMEEFQTYLEDCRMLLQEAQQQFRSMPNPAPVARTAAHLFYCLDRVSDGIDELETFTLNYDEGYLHTGQEMFRIAAGLRWEAQTAMQGATR